eukprot:6012247-Karenia_brevis.AAC.1
MIWAALSPFQQDAKADKTLQVNEFRKRRMARQHASTLMPPCLLLLHMAHKEDNHPHHDAPNR